MNQSSPQPRAQAFAEIERLSLQSRQLPNTPYAVIARSAAQFPDRPALTFLSSGEENASKVSWTYREFLADIHRIANGFRQLGVETDDVVTLLLPNGPYYPLLFWGGQTAGVANPVNPLLDTEHIAGLMNAAQTRVLVTQSPQAGNGLWEKAQAIAAQVPSLKAIVLVGEGEGAVPDSSSPDTSLPAISLSHLIKEQSPLLSFTPSDNPQKLAALFHTGGTTGQPKLAQHTHLNELFDSWSCATALGMTEQDVVLCGLPLFHVNGVIVTGLTPLTVGAHILLVSAQGYRDPSVLQNFWRLVELHRVTIFSGVPTIYSTLLGLETAGHDLSSLRFGICGAAPMPPALLQAVENKLGLKILEGYGLTEGTCVSTINPPQGPRKSGSIGVPLPYHQLRVALLDPEGQFERDCGVAEVGSLLIRGPNVIPGYKEAQHNRGLWIEVGNEQWLNTGDLARLDEEGYFYLAGRKKELIIRSGHNIDPLSIEEAFARHPEVAMAAAVGRPDSYAGEVPVVYVQLRPGATVSASELLDYTAQHISERPALPKAVHIVDHLPMTAVGKLFKPELVWQEIRAELLRALTQAGVPADVQVGQDRHQGVKATVSVASAQAAQAKTLLEQYSVPFAIVEQ